jgi:hypothetical protein
MLLGKVSSNEYASIHLGAMGRQRAHKSVPGEIDEYRVVETNEGALFMVRAPGVAGIT